MCVCVLKFPQHDMEQFPWGSKCVWHIRENILYNNNNIKLMGFIYVSSNFGNLKINIKLDKNTQIQCEIYHILIWHIYANFFFFFLSFFAVTVEVVVIVVVVVNVVIIFYFSLLFFSFTYPVCTLIFVHHITRIERIDIIYRVESIKLFSFCFVLFGSIKWMVKKMIEKNDICLFVFVFVCVWGV